MSALNRVELCRHIHDDAQRWWDRGRKFDSINDRIVANECYRRAFCLASEVDELHNRFDKNGKPIKTKGKKHGIIQQGSVSRKSHP